MTSRFIYKTHKWLAVALAIMTLGWFVSGVIMVLPSSLRTWSPDLYRYRAGNSASAPDYDAARVSAPAAVDAVRARSRNPLVINGMRLVRLPGRLAWEIDTPGPTFLVDATTGEPFSVDEDMARRVALEALGPNARLGTITTLQAPTDEYRGRLPAYKVEVDDGKGTRLFISAPPVEARHTDSLTRVLVWIVAWHGFDGLRPTLGGTAVQGLLDRKSVV